MGNRLIAGRDITWQEVNDRAKVVVLSENLAQGRVRRPGRRPSASACARPGIGDDKPWYEVVGVAGDVRDDGMGKDPVAVVYWPQLVENFWGQDGPVTPALDGLSRCAWRRATPTRCCRRCARPCGG